MIVTFYKGILKRDLKPNEIIPGSVTTDLSEAKIWRDRIQSRKRHGAARHVRHGESVIIRIVYNSSDLLDHSEFQRAGVEEHARLNCWMNSMKTKAQINTPCQYEIHI